MISLTYGQAKPVIAKFAGTSGMPVTDARLVDITNEAVQELMNEGQWAGVVDRFHVVATNGHIVLPPYLDMLLDFTASGVPQTLVSSWAEFVAYGPGPQEDLIPNSRRWWRCGSGDVFDRGETPTRVDIPISSGSGCVCTDGSGTPEGPWVLRQYANTLTAETPGAYATIQGVDPAGLDIRSEVPLSNGSGTEWINGVRLGITSGSGFTETTQEFASITAYIKPVTNGYVRLTAWNGTTEIELSNYGPNETCPSYRKYFSPYLQAARDSENNCCRVVLARARRRFVPVSKDADVLLISNIVALKSMVMAQWKRDVGAMDEYVTYKATAVDLMKKESVVYKPKSRIPALTFQRGFSLGELPAIR